jgi:hypothetical protein
VKLIVRPIRALAVCAARASSEVFLRTGKSLPAAAILYQSAGVQLTDERTNLQWGQVVPNTRERRPHG